MRTLEIEEERLKLQQNRASPEVGGYPVKLKLQSFDGRTEDIMIQISEFEEVGMKAGWTDEIKVHMRTLLSGDARQVVQQT